MCLSKKIFGFFITFCCFGVAFSQTVQSSFATVATVDERDGNLKLKTRDLIFNKGTANEFILERSYHPRRQSVGAFGEGWCTDLDTRMLFATVANEKPVKIRWCGLGERQSFLTPPKLVKDRWHYTHGSITYIFNSEGFLLERHDKTGRVLEIIRNKAQQISEVKWLNEKLFQLKQDGDVLEVSARNEVWRYIFQNERLVQIKNSKGKTELVNEYQPSGFNLKLVQHGLQKWELAFDPSSGLVKRITENGDCTQVFLYYEKKILVSCPSLKVSEAVVPFNNESKLLKHVYEFDGQGRTQKVKVNKQVYSYIYSLKGQISQIRKNEKPYFEFIWNDQGQLSLITQGDLAIQLPSNTKEGFVGSYQNQKFTPAKSLSRNPASAHFAIGKLNEALAALKLADVQKGDLK